MTGDAPDWQRGEGVETERRGNALVIRDLFVPNPKQRRFFTAADDPRYREILFYGSIRGGKSQSCCKKVAEWAWRYPNTLWAVCRATYKELEDSTKRIMLKGDSNMPPALPPELVQRTYEGDHNKVVLRNGSEILFRSLEPNNRGKIRNITYAGAFIDQVEELGDNEMDPDFYEEFLGRLSHPGSPRKMLLAANPESEDHWIAERFGLRPDDEGPKAKRAIAIHVSILDNAPYLDQEYVQDLLDTEHSNPSYFQRMVMGEWGAFGGKRFGKVWNRNRCIWPEAGIEIDPAWEIVEGIDYGWGHPMAWLWFAIDFEGRWWGVHEHVAKEVGIGEWAEIARRVRANDPSMMLPFTGLLTPTISYLDPAAWASKGEHGAPADWLLEHEIYVAKANNERLGGWMRLEEMLKEDGGDGYSRLRLLPHLTHLAKQIASARINPGTDDVEKKKGGGDDALDACRYAILSRLGPPTRAPHEPEDDGPAVLDRASAWRRTVAAVGTKDDESFAVV